MPEDLIENSARYRLSPCQSNVCGSGTADNRTVTFTATAITDAYTPLEQQQQSSLQPRLLELPPVGGRTGTRWRMPASAARRAAPSNTAAGCRDLTKNNRSKSFATTPGFPPALQR